MSNSNSRPSRKTTEGKRDASMMPFGGYLQVVFVAFASETVVGTINSGGCSLRGTPSATARTSAGALVATCTAASLAGSELTLIFDGSTSGAVAIVFEQHDAAIRGPIGQYMDHSQQTTGGDQPPMNLTQANYDPSVETVRYTFPSAPQIIGPVGGLIQATTQKGDGVVSTTGSTVDGMDLVVPMTGGGAFDENGHTTSSGLGASVVSAAGGVAVNDFTNAPMVPQVVTITVSEEDGDIITVTLDRPGTFVGDATGIITSSTGGNAYVATGDPVTGDGTAVITFESDSAGAGTPNEWSLAEEVFTGPRGGLNQAQTGINP